jgi:hypothetical protein
MDTLARMEKSDFLASISFQSKAGGSIMDCIDWSRDSASCKVFGAWLNGRVR